MRIFCLLVMIIPFYLLADLHWASELPGGFYAAVHIPKTRISIDEDLILELTLKYPSTHTPDLDTIRMNLLKYVGITEPPFALKNEFIEKLSKEAMTAIFHMEPQLAHLHFVSFYNIPFLPLNENSQDVKEIISEIFEVEVFLPEINPTYRGRAFGLLSLTESLPISPNRENQLRISDPQQIRKESKRSSSIIHSRSIPWAQFMGILLFWMVVLIIRMQPKQKPNPEKTLKKQAIDARAKALNTLSSLDSTERELFYIDLTNTVRTYIEEQYRIQTTTQTTQEFLYEMTDNSAFDRETQAMLSNFLISSDRVKFADKHPTEKDCLEARQIAEQFINTK